MTKRFLVIFLLFASFGFSLEPAKKKTICLNMIVKNEKDVIGRCLESVKNVIDYWVIFDTGSTDGTQKIIKKFLKNIPGELHQSKWVNFEHNRNEALMKAKGKADYVLLIDADEIWEYAEGFKLPELDKDQYYVTVRQLGAADIKRIGLINNHLDWKWKGVLHEVLECPQAIKTSETLNGVLNICNAVKGARSKEPDSIKYVRDAEVLEKALKDDPTNSRYAFYLGQSYMAADKYTEALKAFEKRIAMPSEDIHETYLALYNKAWALDKLNNYDDAVKAYFKAFEFRPIRAEPLFRISTIYRKQGNYLLGYLVSKFALTIPKPDDLCIEYLTYDHQLLIEFANCALLIGRFEEGLQACCQLLANPNLPADLKPKVMANAELATKQLYGSKQLPQVAEKKD